MPLPVPSRVLGPCAQDPAYKTQVRVSSCGLPSDNHLIKSKIREPGGTWLPPQKTYFSPKVSE